MLETAQERIRLLKAGIRTKNIENLYIEGNGMKMVNGNLLYTYNMIDKIMKEK